MSNLPSEILYGKIVGQFLIANVDGGDVNELPDSAPATGKITFTPVTRLIKTVSPVASVLTTPWTYNLANGFLVNTNGENGVWLITGTYSVSYAITGMTVSAHTIVVAATHTNIAPLDLTTHVPPGGSILTNTQYDQLLALINAGGGGVTFQPNAPSSPVVGALWIDSDNYIMSMWNGTAWVEPAGYSGFVSNVTSVNGQAGVVVLNPDHLSDASTSNKFITAENLTKLGWIEPFSQANKTTTLTIAASDETTTITTGPAKTTFRMPHALTLTGVRASLSTASSSGIPTFDINEGGVSILSTKLTIDANEKTSTTAATAAVISDAALADDAEITIDFDVAGTGARGAKVTLIGTRV